MPDASLLSSARVEFTGDFVVFHGAALEHHREDKSADRITGLGTETAISRIRIGTIRPFYQTPIKP